MAQKSWSHMDCISLMGLLYRWDIDISNIAVLSFKGLLHLPKSTVVQKSVPSTLVLCSYLRQRDILGNATVRSVRDFFIVCWCIKLMQMEMASWMRLHWSGKKTSPSSYLSWLVVRSFPLSPEAISQITVCCLWACSFYAHRPRKNITCNFTIPNSSSVPTHRLASWLHTHAEISYFSSFTLYVGTLSAILGTCTKFTLSMCNLPFFEWLDEAGRQQQHIKAQHWNGLLRWQARQACFYQTDGVGTSSEKGDALLIPIPSIQRTWLQ